MYCILILLALPLAAQVIDLTPRKWTASTNSGRTIKSKSCTGGVCIDIPAQSSGHTVNYWTTKASPSLTTANSITVTLNVSTTGTPVYGDSDPNNTGTLPPSMHVYLQSQGWANDPNFTTCPTTSPAQYKRWWINSDLYDLTQPGVLTITAPLDGTRMSSVCGIAGNANAESQAGLANALATIEAVGVTLGRGYFFGHGLWMVSGTATPQILAFSFF